MKRSNTILLIALPIWTMTACGGGGGTVINDTTAPTISRVAVEPSTLIVPGATVVQVEADVVDDSSGIDTVAVAVAYPDGSKDTKPMAVKSGSVYAVQFPAAWGGNQPGSVRFTVSARDKAGNVQNSSAVEVRAAAPPPGAPW